MWHEALEEASRLYFGEHNIEGMLKVLEPLHEMLEEGASKDDTTIQERAFIEVGLGVFTLYIITSFSSTGVYSIAVSSFFLLCSCSHFFFFGILKN